MNQVSGADDVAKQEPRLGLNGRLVLQHKKPVSGRIIITSPSSNIIMILYEHRIGCLIFTISLPKKKKNKKCLFIYIYKHYDTGMARYV